MKYINETLEKLKSGSCTTSTRDESRDSRDGQHGVVRTRTNPQNYSVSFLLEARARGIKILWMWRLSPTR